MFPESLCGYCQKLPVLQRSRYGRESRCPLCKSKLLTTDQGTIYRWVEEEELVGVGAAPTKHWWQRLGVGIFLLTILAAGAAWYGSANPPSKKAIAPQATVPAAANLLVAAEIAEAAPVETPKGEAKAAGEMAPLWPKSPPGTPVVAIAKMRYQAVALAKPNSVAKPETGAIALAAYIRPIPPMSEENLQVILARVPEVALEEKSVKASFALEARDLLAQLGKEILEKNTARQSAEVSATPWGSPVRQTDGYILELREKRQDLAGLPFLLGIACRAETEAAKALAIHSAAVRTALARELAAYSYQTSPKLKQSFDHFGEMSKSSSLPALRQILATENFRLRITLLEHLKSVKGKKASVVLAQYALFDPESEVRHVALHMLRERPGKDYEDVLLSGLEYPWAQVAWRAGQALVYLNRTDLLPTLVDYLDKPNPAGPVMKEIGGTQVYQVRELVRINHHRNCMLCHAPQEVVAGPSGRARRDPSVPAGAVPVPGEELPPSASTVYYQSFRPNTIVVRADITYLRQDFSTLLPVPNSGVWPQQQRFDFLVRTREISSVEANELANRDNVHRQYVLYALQVLSGLDLGPDTRQWREEIARLERSQERSWATPCAK